MKKSTRKLSLSRETIRNASLAQVTGGSQTSYVPSDVKTSCHVIACAGGSEQCSYECPVSGDCKIPYVGGYRNVLNG